MKDKILKVSEENVFHRGDAGQNLVGERGKCLSTGDERKNLVGERTCGDYDLDYCNLFVYW